MTNLWHHYARVFLGMSLLGGGWSLAWGEPIVGIDQKDLVKDRDLINQSVVHEAATAVTEDLKADGVVPKVEVIIDSSGSMAQILAKNKTKMFFLKELMKPFFKARWKEKNVIGLRSYGGSRKASCDDHRLLVPFGDKNLSQMESSLMRMEPFGMTPLHKSLVASFDDLKGYSGPKRVVVVTDGEDTCGGDPCQTVEELDRQKLDLKFYVIALGFKGESDSLKKIRCIGDTQVADNEESFQDALSQVSSKLSNQDNLRVLSPNPQASVYLYELVEGKEPKLTRVFYANSPQTVPVGKYMAIVHLNPPFQFSGFEIKPGKRTTLKVAGDGLVTVHFFNRILNAEILDKNNKVIRRFKSDTPTEVTTGKWRLRVFKDPFYERIFPEFYVFPKGKHDFDIHGAGVVKVGYSQLNGLYVYDQDNTEKGQGLTNSLIVLKSGVYSFHVSKSCSFEQVQVLDQKEILVLPCEK